MSLLNQQNKKGKKKDNRKGTTGNATSKFIAKPKSGGFVNKQSNTGSQRGS